MKDWIHPVSDPSVIPTASSTESVSRRENATDIYFSADIESDGPIPGPYSMLSFALVYAGSFDGTTFKRPEHYEKFFYRELKPISDRFEPDAMAVNGLDRDRLLIDGADPASAMTEAAAWVRQIAGEAEPVIVAYPLGFDWSWLNWYFVQFSASGSPFKHSRGFDIKTAVAVKSHIPICAAGRSHIDPALRSHHPHTHNAVDDAISQAEIFANVFEWQGPLGRTR